MVVLLLRFFFFPVFAVCLSAQLVPLGQPVPVRAKPPVVFLNGYQLVCGASGYPEAPAFRDAFGIMDQLLEQNGQATLFFDLCRFPGRPALEELGDRLGQFLAGLKDASGAPVPQVDVVAHSMGGLVVRSYLAGKRTSPGEFVPPPDPRIRKLVLVGVPHFGSAWASLGQFDPQAAAMAPGSRFLFDLATWNQGTDDLRGLDAVAVVGNAGTLRPLLPRYNDGIVAQLSGSLGFVRPGRTRVLPYCHSSGNSGLLSVCGADAPALTSITSPQHGTARIVLSFLNGTSEWQSVGKAAEEDAWMNTHAGLWVTARTAQDEAVKPDGVTAVDPARQTHGLDLHDTVATNESLVAQRVEVRAATGQTVTTGSVTLIPATTTVALLKPGPRLVRVLPAAQPAPRLSVAPGSLVSLYGEALALAADLPGTRVSWQSGSSSPQFLTLLYVSPSQINALLPDDARGLGQITVQTAEGRHSLRVWLEPAVPSLFLANAASSRLAAAAHGATNIPITEGSPAMPGEVVTLYLTGLGATRRAGGLDVAVLPPAVVVGGQTCTVQYAGRAPGWVGLDQINCLVSTAATPGNAEVAISAGGIATTARLPLTSSAAQ